MPKLSIRDIDLTNKRVFIRVDFNVPLSEDGQTITDDRYFVDRSLTFFRQLADKNLGAAWESFDGHALAIWGKADFVSNEDDHALIGDCHTAALISSARPEPVPLLRKISNRNRRSTHS